MAVAEFACAFHSHGRRSGPWLTAADTIGDRLSLLPTSGLDLLWPWGVVDIERER